MTLTPKKAVTRAPLRALLRVAIIILAILVNSAWGATLSSNVNKNRLGLNETLILQVKYDAQLETSQMDWSSLQTDFEVLGVSPQSNSSVAVVNGEVTIDAKTRWVITLSPKRTGQLTIPAFKIGNDSSQPITITVSKDSPAQAGSQPLTATLSVDKQQATVGEQVLVRIEISAQENIGNLNGSPLDLANADVEALEQQTLQRLENGLARQVIVLSYAVFPTTAGELEIPAQTFTGIQGNNRSVFDTLARRGQQIVARTKAMNIEVSGAQSSDQQSWFPADNVSIESKWSGDISKAVVGEPVTREITITAKGQRASVIPPLQQALGNSPQGYKSYQDQPQIKDYSSADGINGVRTEAQAIVPSVNGELVLPEQRLQWWDTSTRKWQQAILPAETIVVSGIANSNTQSASLAPATTVKSSPVSGDKYAWLWKLATLILGVICLLQFWWMRQVGSSSEHAERVTKPADHDERGAWAALQKSLKGSDASAIRRELQQWTRTALPGQPSLPLQNLPRFAQQPELADQLATQLRALDSALYNGADQAGSDSFSQTELTSALRQLREQLKSAQQKGAATDSGLVPLYPS